MDNPKVTVIIAAYNCERYLADAIKSVLSQNYDPVEIIVVDDGSTDRSAEVVKKFSHEIKYVYQNHSGIGAARNTGIEHSKGSLISFIDADDLWEPQKLNLQVSYMIKHTSIMCTITKARHFLETDEMIPPGFRKELLERDCIGYLLGTLVARKSVFNLVGEFDNSFTVAEDVDWFARAKDKKISMALIPEVLVHKRVHSSNTSLNDKDNNRYLLQALRQSILRKKNALGE